MKNIFIEHEPENYAGGDISITIHVKPNLKYVAEDLKQRLEEELSFYDEEVECLNTTK